MQISYRSDYLHEQLSFPSPSLCFLSCSRGEIILFYFRSRIVKPLKTFDLDFNGFLIGESEFWYVSDMLSSKSVMEILGSEDFSLGLAVYSVFLSIAEVSSSLDSSSSAVSPSVVPIMCSFIT